MDIQRTEKVNRWARDYSVVNGVMVATLSAEKYGLEYNRCSIFYLSILWLVSLWAMVTNMAQACLIGIFLHKRLYISKGW